MNGELKSKFRDRVKFFKKLYFLKKKKGSDFSFLDNKFEKIDKDDKNNNNLRLKSNPNVKKVYRRKKRIVIVNSLNNSNSINVYKDNNILKEENRVVKIKYVRKKRNKFGIDESFNSDVIDNPKYNKQKYLFDDVKHIENNDRELILNSIVGKLENKSKKMLFKLDCLYSDYYNILNYSDEEIDLKECKLRLKEIEKIKNEIEKINKQFNIIKDDKYLDDILDLDDSNLIDDIIRYKRLCSKLIDKKDIYEKYKKIDNYDKVNTYLDKFTKRIDELKEKKERKKEELERRDRDFALFKRLVSSVDIKNERYLSIINSHANICNSILEDVEKIFKSESVNYKIKGLNHLVNSSLKYLFYLSVSPFKGLFPSITVNTLATRHMIRNIRDNLELEEIRKVNYYAKDYEYEIDKNIYDLNNLNNLLYVTLDDIGNLKKEFNDKYGKYINEIREYYDIYKKIEKIENIVKFNMNKVKKIEKTLIKSKEKNKDKLIKIKKLNVK